jgi:hypothetical protein
VPPRATLFLGALAASALCGAVARADGGLVMRAPEACGSTRDLAERIAALVGPGGATLDADVTVTAEASDYRLTVALPGEARELRDTDCRALLEAAAVVIALALRPPDEAPQVAEVAPHVESIAREDEAPLPSRAARRVSMQGWLEVGGQYGLLPGLGGALGAGTAVHGERLGLQLQAHYLWPSSTAGHPAVRVQGVQAALLLRVAPLSRLTLGLGGAAAFLHGRGTRVDHVRSAWLAPASALLEARVTALEQRRNQLGIVAGAGLALVRPHFRVTGHGSVHQPETFQAALGLFWSGDFF